MQRFRKNAEAARSDRKENLQAHQQHGGANRGDCRHLFFADCCSHIHVEEVFALA